MALEGHVVELLFLICSIFATIYYLWGALRGKSVTLRSMAQVAAIEEGVDRAVETGKPAYLCPGFGQLFGQYAGMLLAGLNVFRYSVRMCVRKDAPLRVWCNSSDALPIMDGIYREACVAEGKPEAYNSDNVVFESAMYTFIGQLHRDGVACFVHVGAVGGGGMAEPFMAIRRLGGLTVAGTARYSNNGYLAVYADYPLFSDDIFAAAAVCSGDDGVKGSIVSGDILKVLVIAIVLIGCIIGFAGVPIVDWLSF